MIGNEHTCSPQILVPSKHKGTIIIVSDGSNCRRKRYYSSWRNWPRKMTAMMPLN